MIVCEYGFNQPDRDDPCYSQEELDFYFWIPPNPDMPNHRLSIRKNLVTGDFEVYRCYARAEVMCRKELTVLTNVEGDAISIAFKTLNLQEALDYAYGEEEKYHGNHREKDVACQHGGNVISQFCEKPKGA
jgi:hypothetical protein